MLSKRALIELPDSKQDPNCVDQAVDSTALGLKDRGPLSDYRLQQKSSEVRNEKPEEISKPRGTIQDQKEPHKLSPNYRQNDSGLPFSCLLFLGLFYLFWGKFIVILLLGIF